MNGNAQGKISPSRLWVEYSVEFFHIVQKIVSIRVLRLWNKRRPFGIADQAQG